MASALMATGYWMYINVPQTPGAVVICVIIFNAAFGYRSVLSCDHGSLLIAPVFVAGVQSLGSIHQKSCPSTSELKGFHYPPPPTGFSTGSWVKRPLICRLRLPGNYTLCMDFTVFLVSSWFISVCASPI